MEEENRSRNQNMTVAIRNQEITKQKDHAIGVFPSLSKKMAI
jgi:hypothetical protein